MSQHAQSKDWLKASGKDKDPKQEPRMRALFNIAVQDMDGEAARANAPGLIRPVTVGEETDTSNRTGQTGSVRNKETERHQEVMSDRILQGSSRTV